MTRAEKIEEAARLYVKHYLCPSNAGADNVVVRCPIHESDDPGEFCFPCLFRDALALPPPEDAPQDPVAEAREAFTVACRAWHVSLDNMSHGAFPFGVEEHNGLVQARNTAWADLLAAEREREAGR